MEVCQQRLGLAHKRQSFDSRASRIAGLELSDVAVDTLDKPENRCVPCGTPEWKRQSVAMRAEVYAAKMAALEENSKPAAPELLPCSVCARTFCKDTLTKHEEICKKGEIQKRKRNNFDSRAARLSGLELTPELVAQIDTTQSQKHLSPSGTPAWKRQSFALRAEVHAAKASVSDTAETTTKLIPCEYCGRSFNKEGSLQKHMHSCQKVFKATRDRFDSAQQRLQDLGAQSILKRKASAEGLRRTSRALPVWKIQSMAFRAEVFAAKANAGASAPTSDEEMTSLKKCSTCNRCFKDESFEKHVKTCQLVFGQKRQRFDSSQRRLDGLQIGQVPLEQRQQPEELDGDRNECTMLPSRTTRCKKIFLPEWKLASFKLRAEVHAQKAMDFHDDAVATTPAALYPCADCNRTFTRDALTKHGKYCFAQRAISRNFKVTAQAKKPKEGGRMNTNWRENDVAFKKAICLARQNWRGQLAEDQEAARDSRFVVEVGTSSRPRLS